MTWKVYLFVSFYHLLDVQKSEITFEVPGFTTKLFFISSCTNRVDKSTFAGMEHFT